MAACHRANGPLQHSESTPALHLVAGLAESPRQVPHPPPGRLTTDETPLRPAPLRRHLAAQLRRPRHRGRRLGRPLRRDAHAGLRPVRGRPRRRLDRAHGRDPPPRGGPMTWGACGGRNPSGRGIRWHPMSEAVNRAIRVPAGQAGIDADRTVRPQQDSNLRSRLRRAFRFKSLTITNTYDPAIPGRCGGAGAFCRWLTAGPTTPLCHPALAAAGPRCRQSRRLIHTDMWAGSSACCTELARSACTASRSTASCSRAANPAMIRSAS